MEKKRKEIKKRFEYMKKHYQGTERCRDNKTDTGGDQKEGRQDRRWAD